MVYGALISRLVVRIPDYLQFYAVGYLILLVFDVATSAGRRFVELGHSGRLPYLLSLPLSRWRLYVATALEGGILLAITISLPLVVVLSVVGNLSVVSVSAAVVSLFLVGFGASGLMLALSFLAFKSTDLYLAVLAGTNILAVRFSTVLYPFLFLPSLYAVIALFSPLTYGSDLVRLFLGVTVGTSLNPLGEVVSLSILMLGTTILGIRLLDRLVEGVKSG